MKLEFKMEWVIAVVAFIAGGGITSAIVKNKPAEIQVVEKMVEVDTSLSDTDLLQVPCSSEYMEKNGEALCREMFCRMNTRSGNQSNAATAQECEAISNTINKAYVQNHCATYATALDIKAQEYDTQVKACIEFFDRRL
tara:strand:+ start:6103 stop:6519 length:417 start_codon:yes stop_codon:yes gene_type:complete